MLTPPQQYVDDDLDECETGILGIDYDRDDEDSEDPMCETQLMPAKHGSKSPMLSSSRRLRVPSPLPPHAIAAQPKVAPPPPRVRSDLPVPFPESLDERAMYEAPSMRPQLYSVSEPTGSDVRAPVHRLDAYRLDRRVPRASDKPLPSSNELAARRKPWAISGTPPEFEPFAMPMFHTPRSQARVVVLSSTPPPSEAVEPRKVRRAAVAGIVFGLLVGLVGVAIAHGDLTANDARHAEMRAAQIASTIAARL